MKYFYRDIDRRANTRLELSHTIMILNHEAVSIDISYSGAYCEVETDDVDLFVPGKQITFEIVGSACTSNRLPGKIVRVIGRGVIMRTDEIESAAYDNGKRKKNWV
ncbi:MAG: hypothetical protein SCARUB_02645 [Candidatus Scalindua rubra]|uniref:PilZ domain-containing protein n=1 Tax=Candidatus Scalindua rubra TaxID=1872076 RepID=A0A1E3X9F3_9BACT|nr:MAG: hypothetical protein SCARUB_02645 [Candidatus Scalindua rubra]